MQPSVLVGFDSPTTKVVVSPSKRKQSAAKYSFALPAPENAAGLENVELATMRLLGFCRSVQP
jgi:hypothetical protein